MSISLIDEPLAYPPQKSIRPEVSVQEESEMPSLVNARNIENGPNERGLMSQTMNSR